MKFTSKTDRGLTYVVPHFEQTITVLCCGIALAVPVPDEAWPAVNGKSPAAIQGMSPAIAEAWNAMPFGKILPMKVWENGVLGVDGHRVEVRVLTKPLEMVAMTFAGKLGSRIAPAA